MSEAKLHTAEEPDIQWHPAFCDAMELTPARPFSARERRMAMSVLDVAMRANVETFVKLRKEDPTVDEAFEIIFKDKFGAIELRDVKNLMDSTHWPADLAMSALKIDSEKRERYAKLLAESEDKPAA